jgi:polysaccharide pyruvyl transferase WcaK-like protein
MHAKLGFDFFGTGNVGDDFMLAGFLEVWAGRRPLFGVVTRTQQKVLRFRFPSVEWLVAGDPEPPYDLWLGVGDTPIQILSGPYFLAHLEREILPLIGRKCRVAFLGVGVEREAVRVKDRFRKVLDRVDYISTRDEFSHRSLVEDFGVPAAKVFPGEDLAHIYLSKAMGPCRQETATSTRPLDLAVNFYGEGATRWQWLSVHRWLQDYSSRGTVTALGNECRLFPGSEAWRYAELSWLLYFRRPVQAPPPLLIPNYWASTVGELAAHFPSMGTVLSSRFHCILAAAWAGCRVGVLSRSSKIEALRQQLGIPGAAAPFSRANLEQLASDAVTVATAKLSSLAARATSSAAEGL